MEESVQGTDVSTCFLGERRKTIQPVSLNDPKLAKLKEVLVEWINSTLKTEHIVVLDLQKDLYDGLVLHHLLSRLGGVHLEVEEIAVNSEAQVRKLEVILQALNQDLRIEPETDAKWSVKLIHSQDLLATLHLLVAMVKRYQPDLALPPNVSVEVMLCEVNKGGIKSNKQVEYITSQSESTDGASNTEDPIDKVLQLEEHKIATVKKALLHFVNKNMSPLKLQVADIEKQVHNVTLALEILSEREMPVLNVDPEDVASHDVAATLKVLYALFQRHKNK